MNKIIISIRIYLKGEQILTRWVFECLMMMYPRAWLLLLKFSLYLIAQLRNKDQLTKFKNTAILLFWKLKLMPIINMWILFLFFGHSNRFTKNKCFINVKTEYRRINCWCLMDRLLCWGVSSARKPMTYPQIETNSYSKLRASVLKKKRKKNCCSGKRCSLVSEYIIGKSLNIKAFYNPGSINNVFRKPFKPFTSKILHFAYIEEHIFPAYVSNSRLSHEVTLHTISIYRKRGQLVSM